MTYVALLKLDAPVDFAVHVIPICLPEDDNKVVGRLAWVKGYGYLSYNVDYFLPGNRIIIHVIILKMGFLGEPICNLRDYFQ